MGKKKLSVDYSALSWIDLKNRVESHRANKGNADFWAMIDQNHFDVRAVERLISYDWKAEYLPLDVRYRGECIVDSKLLVVNSGLETRGLERDVTLAHEAVHAHFWDFGFDLEDDGLDKVNKKRYQRNYMVVEWLARKAQSDPFVLRALVEGFGFQPLVYDQSSRRAFVRAVPDVVVLDRHYGDRQLSLALV